MRIGVISDTHLTHRTTKLPSALVQGLRGVDLILHAGDWVSLEVLPLLEQIAPCDGVAGNNDGSEIVALFGRRKLLTLVGYTIGIVHGDGIRKTTEERARETFAEESPDIIIFGHSHIPWMKEVNGTLMFNPGSAADKRRQPQYSFGLIELGQTIQAQHHYYSDKT